MATKKKKKDPLKTAMSAAYANRNKSFVTTTAAADKAARPTYTPILGSIKGSVGIGKKKATAKGSLGRTRKPKSTLSSRTATINTWTR